jgi:hypothetical protein
MTLRRVAVSVSLVAAGVLGLTACGSDKPSGVAPFTPNATGTGSSPTPTSTSKWTPEQQQVIDGYDRFIDLQTAISSGAQKGDVATFHKVAKEPFANQTMKGIALALSAGFVQTGKAVNTISSVTLVGETASIKTCLDQTHLNLINPSHPSAPRWEARPPSKGTVLLVRERDVWLVSGYKGGEGTCITG